MTERLEDWAFQGKLDPKKRSRDLHVCVILMECSSSPESGCDWKWHKCDRSISYLFIECYLRWTHQHGSMIQEHLYFNQQPFIGQPALAPEPRSPSSLSSSTTSRAPSPQLHQETGFLASGIQVKNKSTFRTDKHPTVHPQMFRQDWGCYVQHRT